MSCFYAKDEDSVFLEKFTVAIFHQVTKEHKTCCILFFRNILTEISVAFLSLT